MTNRSIFKSMSLIFTLSLLLCTLLTIPFACTADNSSVALLDIGSTVNVKMKSLAADTNLPYWETTDSIKAIRISNSLPIGFVPSEPNTVSSLHSKHPIYIFFDNNDDSGIMYFYTEGNKIVMNPDSSFLFANNNALTDISDIANWDSSIVTNMYGLFGGVESLSDISALKHWNTSNVTNMSALFSDAKSLPDALALKNWDTSSVTNMSHMFSGASSLMLIDVSNWNTSKVTDMSSMFQVGRSYMGDGQLREINGLGSLDVSNVTDMTCMFYGAGQMTYYDITNWNVSKVESMNHMFCDNFRLKSLDLSNWDVSSVKTIYCMFDDCGLLKTIGDVSHWNTSNLIDAGSWLNYATAFVGNNEGILDLSGWDTSNLKAAGEMFLKTKIHMIDLSGWTFDSITNKQWEGAGQGIYYETCNYFDDLKGFGQMFKDTPNLKKVYLSQSGLDSFNAAVEREVNTVDMWTNSKCNGFTVK